MDLIVFNMSNYSDWEAGIVNRNYFILRELLKQKDINKVMLVDFLAIQSVNKIFGKQRTWQYTKNFYHQAGESVGLFHKISKINTQAVFGVDKEVELLTGLGYLTSSEKDLKKLQVELGKRGYDQSSLLIWSYNAFLPQAMELPAAKTVFDTVDNWSEHASYKKESGLLKSNYEYIDKLADIIFTVSEGLVSLYTNQNVYWVANGVDAELFANVSRRGRDNQQRLVVGYVGTIQERVDFELIAYLCQQHPDKDFHFYGPVWSGVADKVEILKKNHGNIFFHGRKPYRELPQVFSKIDVAIIPHSLDAFLESTNPMKMYDYLAAGKPVVTTPGAGTDQFADVLAIESTKESFSEAINKAIKSDSDEKIRLRKASILEHSWGKKAVKMLEKIGWE